MPKEPNGRIEPAKQMYLDGTKLIDTAKQLDLPEGTVRRWKSAYKWDNERSDKKNVNVRKKRGGQPGNRNVTGPPGNRHAEKYGFFTKWLPEETMAIMDEIRGGDPLDLLQDDIQLQYIAIVRIQKLIYVKNHKDKTKGKIEYKDRSIIGEKWEVRQVWDKHATFISAQSRTIGTLLRLTGEHDELLHKNWDTASAIQGAQLRQIKAQTDKLTGNSAEAEDLGEAGDMIYGEDNEEKNNTMQIRTEAYRLHPEVCSVYNQYGRGHCTCR